MLKSQGANIFCLTLPAPASEVKDYGKGEGGGSMPPIINNSKAMPGGSKDLQNII